MFQRVGYVVKEVQDAVHAALASNAIIDVSIKYVTDWYRMDQGSLLGCKNKLEVRSYLLEKLSTQVIYNNCNVVDFSSSPKSTIPLYSICY